jgi:hypothetical protein
VGLISGVSKKAKLMLVTTTSSLGRSSIYNRLKLPGLFEYVRLGTTEGWGHFQIPDEIFLEMRELLATEGHKYANGNKYGDGPNWKVRVIRAALKRIRLPEDLLRHGIRREAYGVPLDEGWRDYLCGKEQSIESDSRERSTARQLGDACIERWVVPRANRDQSFRAWTREQTHAQLVRHFQTLVSINATPA